MQTCLQPAAAAREEAGGRAQLRGKLPAPAQPTLEFTAASETGDLGAWQALPEPWTWPQALTQV